MPYCHFQLSTHALLPLCHVCLNQCSSHALQVTSMVRLRLPVYSNPAFRGTVPSTWALPLNDVAHTSLATKWPHLSCLLACAPGLRWLSNLYALIPKQSRVPRLRASSARCKHKCSDRPSWPVTPLVKHFRVPLTLKRGRCLSYIWYAAQRHLSGRASGSPVVWWMQC